ncbi:MAG: hypothetical protein ACYCTL_11530 [Acidimicrobiales bacterium]
MAVVGTLGPWPPEAADVAADLTRGGDASLVELAPLSATVGLDLLDELLRGSLGSTRAMELWRACDGNPLLLKMAAATLGSGQDLPRL